MSVQGRLFEGFEVELQQASLGRFDIEEEDERYFVVGRPVVLVVTAMVDLPAFGRTKDGNLKRINKLVPHVMRVADGVMRDELIEFYSLVVPGEGLVFPTAVAEPRPVEPRVDVATGEVPMPSAGPADPFARQHDAALASFLGEGTG